MQEVDGHGTQRVVLRDEQSGKHGWAASPAPVTLICCQVLGERGGEGHLGKHNRWWKWEFQGETFREDSGSQTRKVFRTPLNFYCQ